MSLQCNLGMDAVLYVGPAGGPQTSLIPLEIYGDVTDVTLNLTKGEADVTTRSNNGWRSKCPTLREASVDITAFYKGPNPQLELLRDAYLDNSIIGAATMTGPEGVDREGIVGDWYVSDFTMEKPMEEGVSINITLELNLFGAWIEEDGDEESSGL